MDHMDEDMLLDSTLQAELDAKHRTGWIMNMQLACMMYPLCRCPTVIVTCDWCTVGAVACVDKPDAKYLHCCGECHFKLSHLEDVVLELYKRDFRSFGAWLHLWRVILDYLVDLRAGTYLLA